MSSEPLDKGRPTEGQATNPKEDVQAFRSLDDLYLQMGLKLERLAWAILRDRALAADAVQEAFGLLASKQDQVEWKFVEGWLVKAVQNVAHNLRRKQNRSLVSSELVGENLSCRVEKPDGLADTIEDLKEAIQRLPPEQLEIVRRRLVSEDSFREIAEELELSLGTVLSRMRLAIQKLRHALRPDREDTETEEDD